VDFTAFTAEELELMDADLTDEDIQSLGQEGEVEGDQEGLSGGLGDGERQKMDLNVGKEGKPVAESDEVAQAEVESRDEGFGGGSEAKEFVKTMNEKQA
jgi:hypothetical protein